MRTLKHFVVVEPVTQQKIFISPPPMKNPGYAAGSSPVTRGSYDRFLILTVLLLNNIIL